MYICLCENKLSSLDIVKWICLILGLVLTLIFFTRDLFYNIFGVVGAVKDSDEMSKKAIDKKYDFTSYLLLTLAIVLIYFGIDVTE